MAIRTNGGSVKEKTDTTFTDMLTFWGSNGYDSAESVFEWLWVNGFIRLKPLKKFAERKTRRKK